MFAVIKTGGKQYKVAAGGTLAVEKLAGQTGDPVAFDDVFLVGGESGVTVGSPLVDGASVAGEIVAQTRSDKVLVFKKRRRKGYKRTHGHRQEQTVVRITEILTDGKKATAAPKAKAKAEAAPKAKAEVKPAEAAAPTVEKPAAKKPAEAPKAAAKKPPETKVATEKPVAAGPADDLKKLSGVGPVIEKKLHGLGIATYAEIAAWTKQDIARVDESLNFKGRIERDDWVGQAKKLAAGKK